MTFQDLIITPIYFIVLTLFFYFFGHGSTNRDTRKYFLPALWAKFLGAIALGFVYQFHYGGGDTFNYFDHGSKWIYRAVTSDFITGIKLFFESGGERQPDTFQYSQGIWYYRDIHSYFVVKIAAFFDLFTLHTYSATALFFASFSFLGSWKFFTAVQKRYPNKTKYLAWAILFVPTVIFWGSGILKDSITLGGLGLLSYAVFKMIEFKRLSIKYLMLAFFAVWIIYSIKVYIVIAFLPAFFVWIFWKRILAIKPKIVRVMVFPVMAIFFGGVGYFTIQYVSGSSEKYALDAVLQSAATTAYDNRYGWGSRTGGDGGYDIGIVDGSIGNMLIIFPKAINVSLFRPYLWEARNPLMLISALESLVVFILTFWILIVKRKFKEIFKDPFLIFCLVFSVLFAFAVGISAFNFGTLMRYKIPFVPYYMSMLAILYPKR